MTARYLSADDIAEIFGIRRRYVVENTARWGVGFKVANEWRYTDEDVAAIEQLRRRETGQARPAHSASAEPARSSAPRTRAADRVALTQSAKASNVRPLAPRENQRHRRSA